MSGAESGQAVQQAYATKQASGIVNRLGSGIAGDTTIGSAADLEAFASTDQAKQLVSHAFPSVKGGGASSVMGVLQQLGITGTGGLYQNGTISNATQASSNSIIAAYQQWLKGNAAYKGQVNAADALVAAQPGRQQTILTPQTAAGPKSLLGGA